MFVWGGEFQSVYLIEKKQNKDFLDQLNICKLIANIPTIYKNGPGEEKLHQNEIWIFREK